LITTTLISFRFDREIESDLWFNGRIGIASFSLNQKGYALEGPSVAFTGIYTSRSDVSFYGSGFGFTGGLEKVWGKFALGAAFSYITGNINNADGAGTAGGLDKTVPVTIYQTAVTGVYYFR
jgi:hypothetical protein